MWETRANKFPPCDVYVPQRRRNPPNSRLNPPNPPPKLHRRYKVRI
jgi:hypothetical protein